MARYRNDGRPKSSRWVGPTIPCAHCGEPFTQTRSRWRYCKRACSNMATASMRARSSRPIYDRKPSVWAKRHHKWMRAHRVTRRDYLVALFGVPNPRHIWVQYVTPPEPHPIHCFTCGTYLFDGVGRAPNCPACKKARKRQRRQRDRKRNGKGSGVTDAELLLLAERDGWRCHLCGRKVDPRLARSHPSGPSPDHLVPRCDGGGNDPANLALAHLKCNVHRREQGTVQLRLTP